MSEDAGEAMTLSARCHTLRPDRHSGWLTFFELTESGARAGHFLVVGPGPERNPDAVQGALRAGQAAVRYLKEVPAHAPPLTLLEATARILEHESGKTGAPLEFGCAVLDGDELWLLTRGEVRLVLLAPDSGIPFGAERPHAVAVRPEERYFFGRVAQVPEAVPVSELRARLERGGGDGGLVLHVLASDRLREVVSTELPEETPQEAPERPPSPAIPDASPPPAAAVSRPVVPAADSRQPEGPPASSLPLGPPTFDSMVEELRASVGPDRHGEIPPAPESGDRVHPSTARNIGDTPEPPEALDSRGETSPGRDAMTLHASTADAGKEAALLAPEESRGIGFWLAVTAAAVGLGALAVYLFALRPGTGDPAMTGLPEPEGQPEASAMVSRTPVAASGPRLLWEDRFAEAVTSSPIVVGDRVVFGCRDGRVYALSRGGDRLWAHASQEGFGSSPARIGDLVVLGGYDGTVYALDPATGEARWTFPTQGRITASPAVDSTTVFIGSYDHHLYALDGARGSRLWSRDLGAVLWASPAVGEGIVVAAGLDGRLTAMDAATGRVHWRASLGSPIHSSPAVGEGKVLVGSKAGDLIAFDLAGGAELWRAAAGSAVNGSPAIHDGWAVVGTEAGRVIGVDLATGSIGWRFDTGGEVRSRPAFTGSLVWITGYDGVLRGLAYRTGEERVSFPAGSSAFSSPAVAGDTVYFGALDGRFLAVGAGAPPL